MSKTAMQEKPKRSGTAVETTTVPTTHPTPPPPPPPCGNIMLSLQRRVAPAYKTNYYWQSWRKTLRFKSGRMRIIMRRKMVHGMSMPFRVGPLEIRRIQAPVISVRKPTEQIGTGILVKGNHCGAEEKRMTGRTCICHCCNLLLIRLGTTNSKDTRRPDIVRIHTDFHPPTAQLSA